MTLQKRAASAGLAVALAMAVGAARPVSSQDRTFMDQASQINLAEISLGRYVQAHATSATAKHLGARYVRDHTQAQASLQALATRLHVTLPTARGVRHQSMVARVEGQKGRMLGFTFARVSVRGHRAAIAIFRKEASGGSNPQVKAYAAHYLPVLWAHLRLAEHAQSAIRVGR